MGPRLFRRGNDWWRDWEDRESGASMGPRLFRRGNLPTGEVLQERLFVASMGPRLFRRGNSSANRPSPAPGVLQWGHVFSDVEIPGDRPVVGPVPHASMGPRLFRRGNPFFRNVNYFPEEASMGPRLFRRGNPIRFSLRNLPCFASMGPRLFRRGNLHRG